MYLELLQAVLAATLFILIRYYTCRKKHAHIIFGVLCVVYTACVVYFTMIRGGRLDLTGFNATWPLPFWKAIQYCQYGLTTNRSVLNVILFIPLGYLLSDVLTLKSGKRIRWWQIALCGFAGSLAIETTQLVFHRGVFELDDLIKNTMGAAVGYAVWRGLERLRKKPDKKPTVKNKERNNADD